MTTINSLFAEEIYIKGVPFVGGSTDLSSIENDVSAINAVIAGLTGGQPSSPAAPEPIIQNRAPTETDDISENWDVGSIWISDQGYVCLDNTEGKVSATSYKGYTFDVNFLCKKLIDSRHNYN